MENETGVASKPQVASRFTSQTLIDAIENNDRRRENYGEAQAPMINNMTQIVTQNEGLTFLDVISLKYLLSSLGSLFVTGA